MSQPEEQNPVNGTPPSRTADLESRLRQFFGKQEQLLGLLDRTRKELDDLAAELSRFRDGYCTNAAREEEYNSAVERVLGINPRIDLKEVEDILAGRSHCDMKEFIGDLEKEVRATPSQGDE